MSERTALVRKGRDPRRGAEYEALKRRVREEESWACRNCGAWAKEVDHIVPLAADGELMVRENLQLLCGKCHVMKTERERPNRIPGRVEWGESIRERYGQEKD